MNIRRVEPAGSGTGGCVLTLRALWGEATPKNTRPKCARFSPARIRRSSWRCARMGGWAVFWKAKACGSMPKAAETSPVGYIEGWYVDADLRRRGWAARSCGRWRPGRANAACARGGFGSAWIENETSIAAHKRLGYEEVERMVCFVKRLA